jgi:hypothetical protein
MHPVRKMVEASKMFVRIVFILLIFRLLFKNVVMKQLLHLFYDIIFIRFVFEL